MPGTPFNPPRLFVSALPHPERAVVLALRALVEPADCRGWVMWDFGRLFPGGGAAAGAFAALRGFVRVLAGDARAEPRVYAFEGPELAADEQAVLSLCAAIQANDAARTEALLTWLFPKRARAAALGYLGTLARMMADNGAKVHPRQVAFAVPRGETARMTALMRVGPVGPDADVGDQRHA